MPTLAHPVPGGRSTYGLGLRLGARMRILQPYKDSGGWPKWELVLVVLHARFPRKACRVSTRKYGKTRLANRFWVHDCHNCGGEHHRQKHRQHGCNQYGILQPIPMP